MQVCSRIESGNISVVDHLSETGVRLEIWPDSGTDFLHWFHFRAVCTPGAEHSFHIINAGDSRTPKGWADYRAFASYDRETWFRVPTRYRSGTLSIVLTPQYPVVWLAHFPPYPRERHDRLLALCQQAGARISQIGESLQGRPIDLVTTAGEGPPCWILAGQHPGEPMASWFAEGLLRRLFDPSDALAAELLAKGRFLVVPNCNPDGSASGRLRTNMAGVDLNRAWRSSDNAPEIAAVKAAMDREGVDLLLDIHGDETIPTPFVVNSDSVPGIPGAVIERRKRFEHALDRASADFTTGGGYEQEAPGTADMDIGANWATGHFQCLALTLEQPFKEGRGGWSLEKSRRFGADVLTALNGIL